MTANPKSSRVSSRLLRFLLGGLMAGGLAFSTHTASAQDQDEPITIVDGCMQDVAMFGLNCTANDIRVAAATNINIVDDGCAFPGDTVTFSAEFQVILTARAS